MGRITAAAVRVNGTIHTGTVHFMALCAAFPDCTPQAVRAGAERDWPNDWDEGFVTDTGRFVSRDEAAQIAKDSMTRYRPQMNDGRHVFVFGSNLMGYHKRGAALDALTHWGAVMGQGHGRQGMAYAIPTKDADLRPIGLVMVEQHVEDFLAHARAAPDTTFLVTRIGCGLAGFKDEDIAPMFIGAPPNCTLPVEW